MKIFAIGDLHLGFHENINKPMSIFGKGWEGHWKKIKQDWEQRVRKDDLVIVLGDISWGLKLEEAIPDIEFISNLPGKKIFLKGNHDLWWNSISKLNKTFPSINFLQNNAFKFENTVICGTRGWTCPGSDKFTLGDEKIYKREVLRLKASIEKAKEIIKEDESITNIVGCLHYPPTNEKKQVSEFTQIFSENNVQSVFYGHLHGTEVFSRGLQGNLNGTNYYLASADYLEFKLHEINIEFGGKK